MSQIVLLSIDTDTTKVAGILDALVDADQDVWWQQIPATASTAGSDIKARLDQARCVILIWSAASSDANATVFHALAASVIAKGRAICVTIDDVDPPPLISGCTVYDMRGWRSRPPGWRKLLGGSLYLRDLISAARFKTAGRDPPPISAPRDMLVRQMLIILPAVGTVLFAVPVAVGLWVDLGLANRPSADENKAWAMVKAGSCPDLRNFLSKFPRGYHSAEAQALLDGRKIHTTSQWETIERPLPIYVATEERRARHSREDAVATARQQAISEAERVCSELARAGSARLKSFRVDAFQDTCAQLGADFVCGVQATAICRLDEPRDAGAERCDRAR